jgi:octanoyl-[GcvH]:protein N-octanoyltransferase
MVRGAWLFSAVAVFDGAADRRPVLTAVYRSVGLPFAAASVP